MVHPKRTGGGWLVLAGLVALCVVPFVAGVVRLTELGRGAEITPANARFFASPVPVVLHIVCVSLFSVLGAFQFVLAFRRRFPRWHRRVGQLLVVWGLGAALTGLWMSHFYPWPEGDGTLVYAERLLFGSAMVGCMILGYTAVRRKDFAAHGAWLTRGYALGMGAGTQVLTHLLWFLLVGKPGEFQRALLMGAAWVINLAVAEWSIRLQAPTAHHFNSKATTTRTPSQHGDMTRRPVFSEETHETSPQ
ncbi:MAG: DUF2306 domain-containing protein [Minicystis sp.]